MRIIKYAGIALFAFFCEVAVGSNSNDTNYKSEIKQLMIDYSASKKTPVVITPEAINEYIHSKGELNWLVVGDIGVAYSKNQNIKNLIASLDKNIASYKLIQKEKTDLSFEIGASQGDMFGFLKYFSQGCNIKFKIIGEPTGEVTFYSKDSVPLDLGCRVFIYSFTVNGIALKADKKNNTLIASQKGAVKKKD
jgi:hypothetical protein